MPESISFRPETDDDLDFLFALYASTREEEMKIVPWTAEQKDGFLRQQFGAQRTHYRGNYRDADYRIILRDGVAIGRLYLHQMPGDLRIMDIALVPAARGGGLGSALLREILEAAGERGDTVSIHVEQYNPAYRLYRRLGFVDVEQNGPYMLMRWSGNQVKTASYS